MIEAIVSIALLGMIMGIFASITTVLSSIRVVRAKLTQISIANEKIELINNLPYASVGTVGGTPAGVIAPVESISRNNQTYAISTTVLNIDDPFDGTTTSYPGDSTPDDYKLAEVRVVCTSCPGLPLTKLASRIAPPSSETITTTGALSVLVTDSLGVALSGATVTVVNTAVTPNVNLSGITSAAGAYTFVGLPPSAQTYHITVTKSGYSTDQTRAVGATGNPNPTKPHATITAGSTTQASFAIDRTSTLTVHTSNSSCTDIANIPFTLTGAKIVGTTPTVYKYIDTNTTNSIGERTYTGMEWDAYTASETSSSYTLAGTVPLIPSALLPNSTGDIRLVLAPRDDRSLLVTVLSATTGLPIDGATVELKKGSTTITNTTPASPSGCVPPGQTLFTGRGNGNHTLTVSKSGYTTHVGTFSLSADENSVIVTLAPN